MKIRGSVMSSKYILSHAPEDEKKKKRIPVHFRTAPYIALLTALLAGVYESSSSRLAEQTKGHGHLLVDAVMSTSLVSNHSTYCRVAQVMA